MYRPVILWALLSSIVAAHDMTPTYPKWKMSFIPSAKMTSMEVFNKRSDVQWYQIGVFDKDWQPIPFVTRYKILRVKYLSRVKFDVYVNDNDSKRAEYICSTSKLRGNDDFKPIVESKICSRFK
jgi:hypothetical protein|tara:strand:- start:361 stop:732 length:372 start_codon:yes stop_codon:yes gene_type:complete